MSKPLERKLKKNHIQSEYCYLDGKRQIYLTKRESQCFSWVIRGMSAKSIGKKMCIKPGTVAKYILILKEKMRCYCKDDLIEKAIKDGMTATILSWSNEK